MYSGGGILFLIWKIKKVLCFLCPRPKLFAAALLLPVCLTFFADVSSKKYTDIAKYPVRWHSEMENWARGGAMVYNAENIQRFKSFFSSVPDNYSKETIKSFKAPDKNRNSRHLSFDKLKERPTVVLIMAESLFDVMRLDDVEFNLDATATVRAYQQGTMISPSFGGGTARVEFEGLTGYSNIFLPSGAMAYTTYFNNPDRRVPSIASAFSAAGYTTTAVHLNDPLFFNRRNVYEILGFDKFISKDDYTFTRNQLVNGLVRDSEFFRIIEEQLEKSDAPQFIFGISIEGHAPYNKHYKETEIKVVKSAKELSRDAVYTLEQYAQYVKNFDDDLAEFISYLKKSEKPVILYVWGDHLPKLPVFDEIDYFKKDKNNRWATPLLVYSNCAQIAIDAKYMTPNQVAPQVLSDSGIQYNSFYDYVYSLRKTLPVLHRSYLKKDDWNSEKLKEYQLLQYDLMFGNQYLFADN